MKSLGTNVVPINVLPTNVLLITSRNGGCQSWRNSKIDVAKNTNIEIFQGFTLSNINAITRHQNISYNIPPKELLNQLAAIPLYNLLAKPNGVIMLIAKIRDILYLFFKLYLNAL